jgi:uncharacterized cupredoxin-like copper-binding protein
MKRMFPLLIVLVMFIISACGSSATTTQAPTQQPAATQAPTQSAATEASTQAGATQAPASGSDTTVNVSLADNTITASTTTFKVGVPYTFVITNTGRHAHNFNINPPISVTGSLDASLNKALLVVPQEKLRKGASTTVTYTFPDSAAGQLLELSCLIRQHYEDGMHVDITVEK